MFLFQLKTMFSSYTELSISPQFLKINNKTINIIQKTTIDKNFVLVIDYFSVIGDVAK